MTTAAARKFRSRLRVLLQLETDSPAGRGMLSGVARYVRENQRWAVRLVDPGEADAAMFTKARCDGVLGRLAEPVIFEAVRRLGIPAVSLPQAAAHRFFPQVGPDDAVIGRMATMHLIDRGVRTLGYIGWQRDPGSDRRAAEFIEAGGERGCACSIARIARDEIIGGAADELLRKIITGWVRAQSAPLGLMLCCDELGPAATQACRDAELAVPEQVAIVGVDNDEAVCGVCDPPLSSIDPDYPTLGYRAAALLDQLMSSNSSVAAAAQILVPPRHVVSRESTAGHGIADPVIAAALAMIREHACQALHVEDVAARLPVSRSVLQRRFRLLLGRSIHEEILRVQLERAKALLCETDLPIRAVAERAGFRHPEYLAAVFKLRLGVSPRGWRAAKHAAAKNGQTTGTTGHEFR